MTGRDEVSAAYAAVTPRTTRIHPFALSIGAVNELMRPAARNVICTFPEARREMERRSRSSGPGG
jgi:hypothetical protein